MVGQFKIVERRGNEAKGVLRKFRRSRTVRTREGMAKNDANSMSLSMRCRGIVVNWEESNARNANRNATCPRYGA